MKTKAFASGSCFSTIGIMAMGLSLSVITAGAQQQPQPTPAQPQPAQQQQYPELPAGPGKDTLIRICSTCHSPDNVIANGQNREGWENTITKMAGFGAAGTDEEFTAILDYLVKNFPPPGNAKVNVNKATAQQLATGLSLSQQDAGAIVHYREKNGDFKSFVDLKKVPGVDAKKLDAESARLTF